MELTKAGSHREFVRGSTADSGKLQISIFGSITIRRGDVVLGADDLGGPKPRQVLGILLLNFGAAVSKTRIMDLLWGDQLPAAALPTLESYVSVLRRYLQPGSGRSGPLRTVTGGYAIDASLVDLDLDRFESLTKQAAHAQPAEALGLYTKALAIASAPLLADELLPAWAEEERALRTTRVNHVRLLAANTALTVGDLDKATTWASAVVAEDPLSEQAWTVLVLGLERSGQRIEALRAYDRCRRVMDEELGCAPGVELGHAHARLTTDTAASSQTGQVPGRPVAGSISDTPASQTTVEQGPKRERILIVDDHRTFTDLLSGALNREPDLACVGAASSVASAVQSFRDLEPDVVLMDLHLSDGSGLKAAEHILALSPDTRVVMLTGNPSQDALREAAHIGICGYLPKDGSLEIMLDTLRHARPGNMIVHPSLIATWAA